MLAGYGLSRETEGGICSNLSPASIVRCDATIRSVCFRLRLLRLADLAPFFDDLLQVYLWFTSVSSPFGVHTLFSVTSIAARVSVRSRDVIITTATDNYVWERVCCGVCACVCISNCW